MVGAGGAGGDPAHKIANTTQEAMRESPLAPGTALDDAGENRYQDAGDERGAVGRPSLVPKRCLGTREGEAPLPGSEAALPGLGFPSSAWEPETG
uniref:Uncharacterized protein n=1 Tax=Candidatus Kentrum sp. DK TaxID=2126562 RepID=A0A450S5P6_9GAMM|nr:MAG: hypothetical protein BECKDK2373B_GA0170837_101610 [Candidatus Kentron sp. DK]